MPRFFFDKKNINHDTIIIDGDEARHIGKVLRLAVNDSITLFDREGTVYTGLIIKKEHKEIQIRIIEKSFADKIEKKKVILGQAIPKAKKMDLIVQKSTELGVSEIIPFFSLRSIPRFDEKKVKDRLAHWQNIVISSVKQAGISHIPLIESIVNFNQMVKRDFTEFLKLIFWEGEKSLKLKSVLSAQHALKNIIFLVGPEGGFAREEVAHARENGFIPVSLGDVILRAETASITVLSIVQYERGAFG